MRRTNPNSDSHGINRAARPPRVEQPGVVHYRSDCQPVHRTGQNGLKPSASSLESASQAKPRPALNALRKPSQLVTILDWIHRADGQDLPNILHETARHVAAGREPTIDTARRDHRIVAATYFQLLPGRVSTLGGVRAEPGFASEAAQLVANITSAHSRAGIRQIQAVVDTNDIATTSILRQAGFHPATQVEQLLLDLQLAATRTDQLPAGFEWSSTADRPQAELLRLIEDTFVQTLDCPEVNHLRDPMDVLDGFLEDQPLHAAHLWSTLLDRGQPVGCMLMAQHSPEVAELVYMGLHPSQRGKRLGTMMVDRAIEQAKRERCRILATAVDSHNWPALRIYRDARFATVKTKAVLFRTSHQRRSVAA